jgi:hypothetical protein
MVSSPFSAAWLQLSTHRSGDELEAATKQQNLGIYGLEGAFTYASIIYPYLIFCQGARRFDGNDDIFPSFKITLLKIISDYSISKHITTKNHLFNL